MNGTDKRGASSILPSMQPESSLGNGCAITVTKLSKCMRGTSVLDNITLEIPPGRTVGLAGPNGSGKTMLMRALLGLIKPTSGTVALDGKTLWKDLSFPPSVGVLLEGPAFLAHQTGVENLVMLASVQGKIDRNACEEAIRDVGLDPLDRRPYRKYSLGMKQRLGIAAAIMEHPRLIVLDEPTNALDASGVETIKDIVRREQRRGATVIIACHDASTLRELADEIYYLAEGHIDGHETIRKGVD